MGVGVGVLTGGFVLEGVGVFVVGAGVLVEVAGGLVVGSTVVVGCAPHRNSLTYGKHSSRGNSEIAHNKPFAKRNLFDNLLVNNA